MKYKIPIIRTAKSKAQVVTITINVTILHNDHKFRSRAKSIKYPIDEELLDEVVVQLLIWGYDIILEKHCETMKASKEDFVRSMDCMATLLGKVEGRK
jgi:hypothetical protein